MDDWWTRPPDVTMTSTLDHVVRVFMREYQRVCRDAVLAPSPAPLDPGNVASTSEVKDVLRRYTEDRSAMPVLNRYAVCRPTAPAKPTEAYIEYRAHCAHGSRDPQVVYTVVGRDEASRTAYLLLKNGSWSMQPIDCICYSEASDITRAELDEHVRGWELPELPLVASDEGRAPWTPTTRGEP